MEGNAGQWASHKLPPSPPPRQLVSSSSSINKLGTVSLRDGSGRSKLLKISPPQGFGMDLLGILIKNLPHNYEFWCARMMVAGQLGVNNSTTKSNELKFTEEILLMFPRNKLAWSYRQWVYVQGGGAKNDLAFYDKILQDDNSNKFAWNQRLFLVTKFEREAVGEAEVELAIRSILDGPENECPWIYLRSLYINKVVTVIDNMKLDGLFTSVIAFNAAVCLQPNMEKSQIGPRCERDLEVNATMNRKTLANSLETLVCLTSYGYEIRTTVDGAVRSACLINRRQEFPDYVYNTLQFVDPLRAPYWKQRMNYVMEMRTKLMRGQINQGIMDNVF